MSEAGLTYDPSDFQTVAYDRRGRLIKPVQITQTSSENTSHYLTDPEPKESQSTKSEHAPSVSLHNIPESKDKGDDLRAVTYYSNGFTITEHCDPFWDDLEGLANMSFETYKETETYPARFQILRYLVKKTPY